jgi:DNA modification methylase
MSVRIVIGDCRDKLKELPGQSVHCCVSSPPYFGLRDYGTASWDGGDDSCDHKRQSSVSRASSGLGGSSETQGGAYAYGVECGKCGATRIDRQMGLEPTPDEYVAGMVEVFREVRRVLRDDGTLWLNIGDSYAGGGNYRGVSSEETLSAKQRSNGGARGVSQLLGAKNTPGCKPKDLIGIPWLLAFALRADGWYLRQDIIWSKPNPMPESVRDRCTKAHEQIFLLSKSPRYYFDADAISERVAEAGVVERTNGANKVAAFGNDFGLEVAPPIGARSTPTGGAGDARLIFKTSVRLASAILDVAQPQDNFSLLSLDAQIGKQRAEEIAGSLVSDHPIIRWAAPQAARFADGDIPAEQFLHELHRLWIALPNGDKLKEAWRFAFLHIGLVNRDGDGAIGINDAGDVSEIGLFHAEKHTPLSVPLPKKTKKTWAERKAAGEPMRYGLDSAAAHGVGGFGSDGTRNKRSVWEVATQPFSEAHFATFPPALIEPCILAGCPKGGTVLDPFGGAGTTGLVADRLGRNAILIELNPSYAEIAERRLNADGGMFAEVKAA